MDSSKPIGHYLDSPETLFYWLRHTSASVVALNAVVRSGFLDALGEEPVTISDISARCGFPEDKVKRLVYFLASEEVLTLLPDGRVSSTDRTRCLVSMQDAVATVIHGLDAGIPLSQALKKGTISYEERHGKPVFEHFRENPEIAARFSGTMHFMTTLIEGFIFTHHQFQPFELAVDLGGSQGGLLLKLLSQHPSSSGILFDLPEVTQMVREKVTQAQHGDRVEIMGGDFFQSVPAADLYLLKMILHDWNDDECLSILKNIRRASRPGARVVVIECVLPETPQPHLGSSLDMAMLVWSSGRERKLSDFQTLFSAAGFSFDRISENPHGQSVIEAVAA